MASDLYCVTNDHTGADASFIADFDVFVKNRSRAYGHVLADLGRSGNDGGRMSNAIAAGVAQELRGSRKSQARLRGDQDRLGGGEQDRGGEVAGCARLAVAEDCQWCGLDREP